VTLSALDWSVGVALSIGAIYGLRHGALRMATSAVSTIAALYLASIYYRDAAAVVQSQFNAGANAAAVVGYIVVFAMVFAAVEFAGASAVRVMRVVHLGWADRMLGAMLGGGLVAVACGLIVMMIAIAMPPDSAIMRDSKLAPMLLAYNETLIRFVPSEVKSAYEKNRDSLMRYWVETALKAREAAGATPTASPSPR
jgi:membrane protein required for colicin V production